MDYAHASCGYEVEQLVNQGRPEKVLCLMRVGNDSDDDLL